MSLLLATAVLFNCVFIACHSTPQQHIWTEGVVSYSGFQLWSVTPRNKEESEFLRNIRQNYGKNITKVQKNRYSTTVVCYYY